MLYFIIKMNKLWFLPIFVLIFILGVTCAWPAINPPPSDSATENTYVTGEVLVCFRDKIDPAAVFNRLNIPIKSFQRIYPIDSVVNNFRKNYVIEKGSDGWYFFMGKKYKAISEIPNETLFREAYKYLSSHEKKLYRTYKITLAPSTSVNEIVNKLRGDSSVEFAEPNYITKAFFAPNDPLYPQQWALSEISVEGAWDIWRGNNTITIAIIDTGIDYNHPDLADNIWINLDEIPNNGVDDDGNGYTDDIYGYDFVNYDKDPLDDHGHGTHCAGISAARGNNGIGISGVAPYAKVMALKSLDSDGNGNISAAVNAIHYAVAAGAKIINASWGTNEYSQTLQDAITEAFNAGCFIVAAAGNDSSARPMYPACNDHVFSVAALNTGGTVASFSNFGSYVDAAAPGVDILSTVPTYPTPLSSSADCTDGYCNYSGTSMAAPHVAGEAALLLSKNINLTLTEIENAIRAAVDTNINSSEYIGSGRINLTQSLSANQFSLAQGNIIAPEYNNVATISKPILSIRGNAEGSTYRVYYSSSVNPYEASWTFINSGASVSNGELAQLDMSTFSNGPYYILLEVYDDLNPNHPLTRVSKVFFDRFIAPGWPRNVPAEILSDAAAMGDIDADNQKELIVGCGWAGTGGTVHAWHLNGSEVVGWQGGKQTGFSVIGAPALADLDPSYPGLEVIIGSYDYRMYAWHGDGTNVPGWPQKSSSRYYGYFRTPVVGDFDQNSSNGLEVIGVDGLGLIYVWHSDGTLVSGWPYKPVMWEINSVPVLADIDGDTTNGLELVFADSNSASIYILHYDKSSLLGWPKVLGPAEYDIYSSPAVADIDTNFPGPEIIVAVNDRKPNNMKTIVYALHRDGSNVVGWPVEISGSVCDSAVAADDVDRDGDIEVFLADRNATVHGWHHDGSVVNNWPQGPVSSGLLYDFMSSPAIANIDGVLENGLEIIIGSSNGNVYAWHANGNLVNGFPLHCSTGMWSSPVVSDMNADGSAELAIGVGNGAMFLWTIPSTSSNGYFWPLYKNNEMRTGNRAVLLPHIDSISPGELRKNDFFNLTGKNLNITNRKVILASETIKKEVEVWQASDTLLVCRTPDIPKGNYKIQVIADSGESNALNCVIKVNTVEGIVRAIDSAEPLEGVRVILKPTSYGYGLKDYRMVTDRAGRYKIEDIRGYIYSSGGLPHWVDYYISIDTSGYRPYKSGLINFKNQPLFRININLIPYPQLSRIYPKSGRPGDKILLQGKSFRRYAHGFSKIEFINKKGKIFSPRKIIYWDDKDIICIVPNIAAGNYYLRVVNRFGTTKGLPFTIKNN
jgi:subtilisin family serine protease